MVTRVTKPYAYPSADSSTPDRDPSAPQDAQDDEIESEGSRTVSTENGAPRAGERVSEDEERDGFDRRGKFAKGNRVGNRGGRPRGVAAAAREIQERIGYDAMISYAEAVWSGWEWDPDERRIVTDPATGRPVRSIVQPSDADKRWAYGVLWDRGWGKPVVAVDMQAMLATVSVGGAIEEGSDAAALAAAIDDGVLGGSDLDALELICARMMGRAPAARALPLTARTHALDVDAIEAEPAAPTPVVLEVEVEEEPEPPPFAEPKPPEWRAHVFASSSNVEGFVYDRANGVLAVKFKGDRGCYAYEHVTRALVEEWVDAPSAGRWLGQRLKPRADLFPCRPYPVEEYTAIRSAARVWGSP